MSRHWYQCPLEGGIIVPSAPHPGGFGAQRKHDLHTGVDLYVDGPVLVQAIEEGTVVAVREFTGEKSQPPTPWWNRTRAILIEGRSGVIVYGEVATHWITVAQQMDRLGLRQYCTYHPYFEDDLTFPDLPQINRLPANERLDSILSKNSKIDPKSIVARSRVAYTCESPKVGDRVERGEVIGCVTPVLKVEKSSTISRYMLHIELLGHGAREEVGVWKHGEPCPEGLYDPSVLLLQTVQVK